MTPRVHHIHSRATETPDAIERKSCLCWGKCGDVCGIAISSRRHVPRRHSPVPLDHVQEARRSEAHFRRFYSWVTNHFPCSKCSRLTPSLRNLGHLFWPSTYLCAIHTGPAALGGSEIPRSMSKPCPVKSRSHQIHSWPVSLNKCAWEEREETQSRRRDTGKQMNRRPDGSRV